MLLDGSFFSIFSLFCQELRKNVGNGHFSWGWKRISYGALISRPSVFARNLEILYSFEYPALYWRVVHGSVMGWKDRSLMMRSAVCSCSGYAWNITLLLLSWNAFYFYKPPLTCSIFSPILPSFAVAPPLLQCPNLPPIFYFLLTCYHQRFRTVKIDKKTVKLQIVSARYRSCSHWLITPSVSRHGYVPRIGGGGVHLHAALFLSPLNSLPVP